SFLVRSHKPASLVHLVSPLTRPPPRSTLFPYTTLFRSGSARHSRNAQFPAVARRADCGSQGRHFPRQGETPLVPARRGRGNVSLDRKSTRLNSSHVKISYAVFCLKKKKLDLTRNISRRT